MQGTPLVSILCVCRLSVCFCLSVITMTFPFVTIMCSPKLSFSANRRMHNRRRRNPRRLLRPQHAPSAHRRLVARPAQRRSRYYRLRRCRFWLSLLRRRFQKRQRVLPQQAIRRLRLARLRARQASLPMTWSARGLVLSYQWSLAQGIQYSLLRRTIHAIFVKCFLTM